jgi:hypothetical protein
MQGFERCPRGTFLFEDQITIDSMAEVRETDMIFNYFIWRTI